MHSHKVRHAITAWTACGRSRLARAAGSARRCGGVQRAAAPAHAGFAPRPAAPGVCQADGWRATGSTGHRTVRSRGCQADGRHATGGPHPPCAIRANTHTRTSHTHRHRHTHPHGWVCARRRPLQAAAICAQRHACCTRHEGLLVPQLVVCGVGATRLVHRLRVDLCMRMRMLQARVMFGLRRDSLWVCVCWAGRRGVCVFHSCNTATRATTTHPEDVDKRGEAARQQALNGCRNGRFKLVNRLGPAQQALELLMRGGLATRVCVCVGCFLCVSVCVSALLCAREGCARGCVGKQRHWHLRPPPVQ